MQIGATPATDPWTQPVEHRDPSSEDRKYRSRAALDPNIDTAESSPFVHCTYVEMIQARRVALSVLHEIHHRRKSSRVCLAA